jgi:lipoate-protein ligase A
MEVRLFLDPALSGLENMDRDAALLRDAEAGLASIRIYRWSEPCISLGRYQSPERALNAPQETRWVSRPTGGRAVKHGHDLTISMALPWTVVSQWAGQMAFRKGSVKSTIPILLGPIVQALRACGQPCSFGGSTQTLAAEDCFALNTVCDVINEDGHKICGTALRLTDLAILMQASIPTGPAHGSLQGAIQGPEVRDLPKWDAHNFQNALAASVRQLGSTVELQPTNQVDDLAAFTDSALFNIWDPIGINDESAAADEYRSYVGPVLGILRQGDAQALATYLDQTTEVAMGCKTQRGAICADFLLRHHSKVATASPEGIE